MPSLYVAAGSVFNVQGSLQALIHEAQLFLTSVGVYLFLTSNVIGTADYEQEHGRFVSADHPGIGKYKDVIGESLFDSS